MDRVRPARRRMRGSIPNPDDIKPSSEAGGSVAFEVEDLDKLNEELKRKGVEYMGAMIHSPVCRMSIIKDSEGNSIILHELKKKSAG